MSIYRFSCRKLYWSNALSACIAYLLYWQDTLQFINVYCNWEFSCSERRTINKCFSYISKVQDKQNEGIKSAINTVKQ